MMRAAKRFDRSTKRRRASCRASILPRQPLPCSVSRVTQVVMSISECLQPRDCRFLVGTKRSLRGQSRIPLERPCAAFRAAKEHSSSSRLRAYRRRLCRRYRRGFTIDLRRNVVEGIPCTRPLGNRYPAAVGIEDRSATARSIDADERRSNALEAPARRPHEDPKEQHPGECDSGHDGSSIG